MAPLLEASYMQATSFPTWDADVPGYDAMRAAAEEAGQEPNDWFAIGYASGYVMKAILEDAIEADNVTREGVYEAAAALEGVDSEGTLPEGTGNYAPGPRRELRVHRALLRDEVVTPRRPDRTARHPAWWRAVAPSRRELAPSRLVRRWRGRPSRRARCPVG